jgi:hypothetical protein
LSELKEEIGHSCPLRLYTIGIAYRAMAAVFHSTISDIAYGRVAGVFYGAVTFDIAYSGVAAVFYRAISDIAYGRVAAVFDSAVALDIASGGVAAILDSSIAFYVAGCRVAAAFDRLGLSCDARAEKDKGEK